MDEIKIKIITSEWTVAFYTQRAYARRNGADSRAICDPDNKRLEFDFRASNRTTIVHEIVHCYVAEVGLVELQLDDEQQEEFFCELFGRHYREILNNSDIIYDGLLAFTRSLVGKK